MDWSHFAHWLIAGVCVLASGCTICENAHRTVFDEPELFSYKHDRKRSIAIYRKWADQAWFEETQANPDLLVRTDFGVGFRDGFVDFTYAGGTGEPPPVPPRKLWNIAFRNPEGHQRTAEWFAGYRRGAQVSRDGGFRSMATLRSSMLGVPDEMDGYSPAGMPGPEMHSTIHPFEDEPLPTPQLAPMSAPEPPAENGESPSQGDAALPTSVPERVRPVAEPVVPPPPRAEQEPNDLPPADPLDLGLPADEPSPAEPAQVEPKNAEVAPTSVRFVGVPSTSVQSPPGHLINPPRKAAAPIRSNRGPDNWPSRSRVAVAPAASTPRRTHAEQAGSTIEIHAEMNPLRQAISEEPIHDASVSRRQTLRRAGN